jgi:hypothetical protein
MAVRNMTCKPPGVRPGFGGTDPPCEDNTGHPGDGAAASGVSQAGRLPDGGCFTTPWPP